MAKKSLMKTGENMERKKSRVLVKYDVGFGNTLYIRGQGAGLNWQKGQIMKNLSRDEWVWETDLPLNQCEFKVLVNDKWYEAGDNHKLALGANFEYTPRFA